MAAQAKLRNKTTDIAIFGRLLDGRTGDMSTGLARYVLSLRFGEGEQERMRQLALANQLGRLSAEDHEELMAYVNAGHLLALLHSKARKALKKRKVS